ncbi:MAG: response regulator transcription factor [Lewinellaceae bacterium]|nr:response regulator transcription factor [Phaeodactylibacter sp.]MCB0613333.1 response regulator transcription factor [Phaeodactylibacter sp.]MCB9347292.1 response regulator transcription factor [Lewinellaceae bacterium]
MKQIALIEDDQRLSKRMAFFLNKQDDLECVVSAGSLGEFFERLNEKLKLDLLLLDIELSGSINTIGHLQKIKNLLPNIKILVITGHNHPDYLLRALQEGADSFYLKGSGLPKLLEAIDTTYAGGTYLDPEAAVHILPYIRKQKSRPKTGIPSFDECEAAASEGLGEQAIPLNKREQQVAKGLIEGQSYQEIAQHINLSVNTVRHYVKVLYKKFEVANKVQLSNKLKPYM